MRSVDKFGAPGALRTVIDGDESDESGSTLGAPGPGVPGGMPEKIPVWESEECWPEYAVVPGQSSRLGRPPVWESEEDQVGGLPKMFPKVPVYESEEYWPDAGYPGQAPSSPSSKFQVPVYESEEFWPDPLGGSTMKDALVKSQAPPLYESEECWPDYAGYPSQARQGLGAAAASSNTLLNHSLAAAAPPSRAAPPAAVVPPPQAIVQSKPAIKVSQPPAEGTPITTLMICDIPCRQTIQQVIDAINSHGFTGTYDLVYMPPQKGFRRPKQSQNMGYAFVNFKRPEYASAFEHIFKNFSFPNCSSQKKSYAKPAHCQGYNENLEIHSKLRLSGCLLTFD